VLDGLRASAQRSTATALNRCHRLELPQADTPVLGFTPRRAKVAEYIRDFKLTQTLRSAVQLQYQMFEWAFNITQRVSGHLAIACGGRELLVPE